MAKEKEMTAFELCGIYNDENFKLKGGRVIWESIEYRYSCDKCYISRVVEASEGGKLFFGMLNYKFSYIDPDTKIIIVK